MEIMKVSVSRGVGLVVLLSLILCSMAEIDERETVHDDPFVVYPYRLSASSPFGRIPDSVLPGSEVPVDDSLPHFQAGEVTSYLKLQLFRNQQPDNSTNATMTEQVTQEIPTLPPDVMIDVSGEQGNVARVDEDLAFAVNEDLDIVVENPENFREVDQIEFWVVAIARVRGQPDRVVSNPLAFVVRIDHEDPARHGAAIYVGIVVLIVCLIALLIPLTVRTKRRMREGKPVCACGSSSKKLEERTRKESRSGSEVAVIAGKDALAAMLGGRPRSLTEAPEHETFQSHNLRSVSEHHFQPLWLDPHYKDVYVHPDYKARASNMAATSSQPASNMAATSSQPASNMAATSSQPASKMAATTPEQTSKMAATGPQPASVVTTTSPVSVHPGGGNTPGGASSSAKPASVKIRM